MQNYAGLLGVAPGGTAAWALPASYAVVAAIGVAWGLLRSRRPGVYAAIARAGRPGESASERA